MDSSPARAQLVHSVTGRARLRVDGRSADSAFFDNLATALLAHPAVREVRSSALTGSVLILHAGEIDEIVNDAQARGLFELATAAPPARAPMQRMRASIDTLDAQIAEGTADVLSLGKLAFAGLVAAGVWQARRGYLFPASMTVFNYALKVMEWTADREPMSSQTRSRPVA